MERISFNMKCPLCLDEFEGVGHHFCNDRTHDPICTGMTSLWLLFKIILFNYEVLNIFLRMCSRLYYS